MPSLPTVWTLTPPPGGLTLSCSLNGDPGPGATAAVTVTDPHGYWRAASVRDLGCASWADTLGGGRTASGSTERDAVERLMGQLAGARTDLRAEPTGIGYLRAVTQIWFVTSAGRPYITVDVRASGSVYLAQPGLWCADQPDGRDSAR